MNIFVLHGNFHLSSLCEVCAWLLVAISTMAANLEHCTCKCLLQNKSGSVTILIMIIVKNIFKTAFQLMMR